MERSTTVLFSLRRIDVICAWFDGWWGWYYNVEIDTLFVMIPLIGVRWKQPPSWLPPALYAATCASYATILALLVINM